MPSRAPQVRLFFEDASGRVTEIASYTLTPYAAALERPIECRLKRSFGTLIVEIWGDGLSGVHLLVDGAETKTRSIGNVQSLRIPVDRDLAFHRLAFVARPSYSLTIDLVVEHHYQPAGFTALGGVTKWSLQQHKKELEKYKAFFGLSNQREVLPDIEHAGIAKGRENSAQLLMQIIGRLEVLLSTVNGAEAAIDFHETTPGEFDRDAILSILKQDHRHLTQHPKGSVRFKHLRYTTALNQRQARRTRKVDFFEIVALLSSCAATLKRSAAPAISSFLILALIEEIQFQFPGRRAPLHDPIAVLERQMRSPFGALLQGHMRTLVAIVGEFARRDPIDHGLLWLKQSIQDRDVFQASVFACCAKALGFCHTQMISAAGLLAKEDITVANTNSTNGLRFFNDRRLSWRDNSLQPGEYRPDTFVLSRGRPVIIDAKFRMPGSTQLVAEPDGLKDVQAYMNDFDLNAAIVVVPRLLNRAAVGSDGYAKLEARGKSILIIEMQDSDDAETQRSLERAVEFAACHA
jgi:hypothetical protein